MVGTHSVAASSHPSRREKEVERGGYFPPQGGMIETRWWSLGCYHGHSGKSALAHRWYRARTTGGSGRRRDVAGGTPAAQQPPSDWGVTLSGKGVASQRQPARRCCHQHAAP
jgi:hypothetical protein